MDGTAIVTWVVLEGSLAPDRTSCRGSRAVDAAWHKGDDRRGHDASRRGGVLSVAQPSEELARAAVALARPCMRAGCDEARRGEARSGAAAREEGGRRQ